MMRTKRIGAVFLLACSVFRGAGLARAQQGPPEAADRGWGMGGMAANSAHGTVTALDGNEITVKDEQGQEYKVVTGPNTHFRKDRQEARLADVHVGDVVVAMGNVDGKTVGAAFLMVLNPQQAAEMKKRIAEFGKTWTAGKVTAINDLTLTVERPDKATQTIAVDENTLFQKRGRGMQEDITFPDIKVGDLVNARGAMQGNHFMATTLTVMVPHLGPGRFRPGGPGHPAPQPEGAPTGTDPQSPPTQN